MCSYTTDRRMRTNNINEIRDGGEKNDQDEIKSASQCTIHGATTSTTPFKYQPSIYSSLYGSENQQQVSEPAEMLVFAMDGHFDFDTTCYELPKTPVLTPCELPDCIPAIDLNRAEASQP